MLARYKWVAMLIALVIVLTSCGPTPTPATTVVKETVPVPVKETVTVKETVVVPKDKVTVTIAYGRFLLASFGPGPAPLDVIKTEVAKLYPYIDVQINLMPDTVNAWHDSLAVWLTAKDKTVDIMGIDTPWLLEFGKAGWAVPLNDKIPNLENDFFTAGLDAWSYEGKRLAVPFWGSLSALFYRKDLLAKYGFQPPKTFDEMISQAQTIAAGEKDIVGFAWPGSREETLVMVWANMLTSFGGTYYTPDGKFAANSPQGVAAVQALLDTINKVSPKDVIAWDAKAVRTLFAEGKAVFAWHNADIISWLDDPAKSKVAGNWGVMPFPAQPGGKPSGITGGFAFAINPYTDAMDEAVKVMQVIASKPVQKGFAIAWGPVQYFKGLYDDPEVQAANKNSNLYNDLLPAAMNRPPSTNYAELSSILQEELHSAITGIKPVKAALDDACKRIDSIAK